MVEGGLHASEPVIIELMQLPSCKSNDGCCKEFKTFYLRGRTRSPSALWNNVSIVEYYTMLFTKQIQTKR